MEHETLSQAKSFVFVDQDSQFADVFDKLGSMDVWAMDTEFSRERTYFPKLALLQVAIGDCHYLLDPLKLSEKGPISEGLADSNIEKVLHSGREDLEVLNLHFSCSLQGIFDTQVAVAFCGGSLQESYQSLVQRAFDVSLSKEAQRTDWLKRPLSEEQLHYAAADVAYLPGLRDQLTSTLVENGRMEWFREDMQRNTRVDSLVPEKMYLQFRSASELSEEQLAILRDLAYWREKTAIQRDLPRTFVLKNDTLMAIASKPPATMDQLKDYPSMHPATIRRHGENLMAICRGQSGFNLNTELEKPLPAIKKAEDKQCIKNLQKIVKRKAEELAIEPALIASRKQLEGLYYFSRGLVDESQVLEGWRKELVGKALLETL